MSPVSLESAYKILRSTCKSLELIDLNRIFRSAANAIHRLRRPCLRVQVSGPTAIGKSRLAARTYGVAASSPKRLMLTPTDRIFSVWLRRVWDSWKSALMIVKPDTVITWHRKVFACSGLAHPSRQAGPAAV